jgi:AcrR family transcriptional regulator
MRDISEAVGILPGSLYTHISSKEALLLEIVESGIDKYLDSISTIASSSEPADVRMRAAIKAHLAVVAENTEQTLVAVHQWKYLNEANRRRVAKKRLAYEEMFVRIVEDGVESGVFGGVQSVHLAVLAVIGMLNWVPEWFSPSGDKSPDEIADALADVVLSGMIGARPATRKKRG